MGRARAQTEPAVSHVSDPNEVHPLRDGGITWVLYFRRSEVPPRELDIVSRAKRGRLLRLAVTFGSVDPELREYGSTTAVHLWQMDTLPSTVSWREVFVHVFTHEPLHHLIGMFLSELAERVEQELVIRWLCGVGWC